MPKYIILVILWTSYCFLHSFLISPPVTRFAGKVAGEKFRFYRCAYNVSAILTLIPVLIYTNSEREQPFFSWQGSLLAVKYILVVTGILFFYLGARRYDMQSFLGLRQIREGTRHGLINRSGQLDKGGILGIVRHPFYTGSFPLIWSGDLDNTRLIVNITLTLYLVIGTLLEERKLVSEFGDQYRNYRKEVSMLFPLKWLAGKFLRS